MGGLAPGLKLWRGFTGMVLLLKRSVRCGLRPGPYPRSIKQWDGDGLTGAQVTQGQPLIADQLLIAGKIKGNPITFPDVGQAETLEDAGINHSHLLVVHADVRQRQPLTAAVNGAFRHPDHQAAADFLSPSGT